MPLVVAQLGDREAVDFDEFARFLRVLRQLLMLSEFTKPRVVAFLHVEIHKPSADSSHALGRAFNASSARRDRMQVNPIDSGLAEMQVFEPLKTYRMAQILSQAEIHGDSWWVRAVRPARLEHAIEPDQN